MSFLKEVKIYYGMSGTFKRTTISSELKKNSSESYPVWSMIKPWKKHESGIFKNRLSYSDLNYANLHFCILEYLCKESDKESSTLLVERGVSDMIFYWLKNGHKENEEWIRSVVEEESKIIDAPIKKILLVQEDMDFIRNVILEEPSRRACFPGGLEDYLEQQEKYLEFTKKYNDISKIISIKDSRSYIENDLGLDYVERKN